jgi:hypothetical protein
MSVPKTTVYEHNRMPSRQDDIGSARKTSAAKPIAIPKAVKKASHHQFRLRIAASYKLHDV